MKYEIIQTGSSGNCTIINDEIAIDMGVSFEKLKPYYKNLKFVFITHEHGDHFNKSTIKHVAELRPNLKFFVAKYLVCKLVKIGINKNNIFILNIGEWYDCGNFMCKLDEIKHDVPNVAIHININYEKLIYATDTATLEGINAKNYDYYLIEGNYNEIELEERKEEKILNGEFAYEDRVKNTHLSEKDCLDFFMKNAKASSVLEMMHKHIKKEVENDIVKVSNK